MSRYTRREIIEILEIDENFILELEREAIIHFDHIDPEPSETKVKESTPSAYSELMLERARVAHSLVYELDVNLAGAAVIVRMREELGTLRGTVRALAAQLSRDHD